MDEISKEQVLKQISMTNFESLNYLKEDYFNFRNQLTRLPVTTLMSYELIENSPDPIKFIDYSGSYLKFLNKVEPSEKTVDDFVKSRSHLYYQFLSSMLPLRRPIEFYILSFLELFFINLRNTNFVLSLSFCLV
jgi:hypothetical protein